MYVQFVNKEVAEKAPWKHKDKNWPFMDEKVIVIVIVKRLDDA